MPLSTRSKRSGCSIDMINNQITLSKINKYFKKNKVSISEIQKYLKKKGFTISKKKDEKEESNLGSLTRTFLSSLIIIAIFSIAPLVSDLTKKNQIFSKDFENNSKNNLKALIENKEVKIDEDLNNKFLFDDVLQFDEQPVDTVRLSASTIEELFKSTDYNLNDVRKNKLVKPISLTLLPSEIKQIENAKKKKNLFIQIILPLVIKENNKIKSDRNKKNSKFKEKKRSFYSNYFTISD